MHYTKAFPSIKKNPKKKMSTKNKYKQEPITYVAGLVSNRNTCNIITDDEIYVDEACVFNVKTVWN